MHAQCRMIPGKQTDIDLLLGFNLKHCESRIQFEHFTALWL